MVERKFCQIRDSTEKNFENQHFSVLQWDTLAAQTSNTINNVPLVLGNITGDLHNLDLFTPNRLSLGRKTDRSPVGSLVVRSASTWYEHWLISQVPKLMHHSKYFSD